MQSPQKDQPSPSEPIWETHQERPCPSTIGIDALKSECEFYLNSFPGRDSLAPNTAFNGRIRKCLNGGYDNHDKAPEILAGITKMVSYRNNLTRSATKLLTLAGIFKPNGLDCADFDFETFQESQEYKNKRGKYEHAFRQVARFDLIFFPAPDDEEGRPWAKPVKYVAAALTLDENTDSSEEIADAVQRITSSMYMSLFILQWR
ncbi:uncharacterized protein J4E78_007185 [Alternaria triticimaculans]|uniref:uncharacterized protein n=1 Tax=Alternaria triticimaculans TaxID=297637 RepID=UPI0020C54DBF|nr:uncharacterized protein J4E78_007185 [Alternaria triticimaculans]KAI4655005.1 hypothetical protein J4E78_007185 [Alternaria triticimaculans]